MLPELMTNVAHELGAQWTTVTLPGNRITLDTPDPDFLVAHHDTRRDRLIIEGGVDSDLAKHWPRMRGERLRHRITLSPSTSPARIAGEIRRRLLPDYRRALTVAVATRKDARREHEEATQALAAIRRLVGGLAEGHTIRLYGPSSHLNGTITLADGDAVFHLRLPTHHAVTLARVLPAFIATP